MGPTLTPRRDRHAPGNISRRSVPPEAPAYVSGDMTTHSETCLTCIWGGGGKIEPRSGSADHAAHGANSAKIGPSCAHRGRSGPSGFDFLSRTTSKTGCGTEICPGLHLHADIAKPQINKPSAGMAATRSHMCAFIEWLNDISSPTSAGKNHRTSSKMFKTNTSRRHMVPKQYPNVVHHATCGFKWSLKRCSSDGEANLRP